MEVLVHFQDYPNFAPTTHIFVLSIKQPFEDMNFP